MKKRILALVVILTMCGLVMAGCTATAVPSQQDGLAVGTTTNSLTSENSTGSSTGDDSNVMPLSYAAPDSATDGVGKKDLDSSWDISASTVIMLSGATATVSGEGATVSGNIVTITAAGTYVVSGTLSKGQILVNATKDDNVRLVLNGADITADKNAAIYASVAKKLTVILADGTINKLTDSSSYVYADTEKEEPDGALFAKCDLTINGMGTLIVNGNYKNGIRTKDDLVIVSGTFIVNAANNGIHAKDSVMIIDGQFEIKSGNDGIKTSDDEKKGWVEIRGGVFNITAEYDGIQAETDLLISGGEFNIIAGGGSANAPAHAGGFGGMSGMGGRGMTRDGGDFTMPDRNNNQQPNRDTTREMPEGTFGSTQQQQDQSTPQAQSSTTQGDSESRKGLKAKNMLCIVDGVFNIDAYDDAVHSNNKIVITAGTLTIKTGDDGIHADIAVEISGGKIDILHSYEGIESLAVTISGGDITVVADDDGINASNGEGKALNGGRPAGGVNQDAYIRITGGTIDVHGGTDGIDSNGNIFIEGGTIMVSGPSMGAEGAIDQDGKLTITGGEIITAGSWEQMPEETTQPVILLSYTSEKASGSVITVKDPEGNVLLEYTSKTSYTLSGFTSPSFEIGKTFSVYIDGERLTDITISNIKTSVSDTGGAYSGGGRGGPGGGMMPGRGR